MKELIQQVKGIAFGLDAFNGNVELAAILATFWYFHLPIPHGWWRVLVWLIAMGLAVHPDWDMLPYKLIMKRKAKWLDFMLVLGVCLFVSLGLVGFVYDKLSIAYCGLVAAISLWDAVGAKNIVLERASHWPIWHRPVIDIPALALGAYLLCWDFCPGLEWFFVAVVILLQVSHFLHDCREEQGFPLFAPLTDAHIHWRGWNRGRFLSFEVRSTHETDMHYLKQSTAAESRTAEEEMAWRAEKEGAVTAYAVARLLAGLAISLPTLYFVP